MNTVTSGNHPATHGGVVQLIARLVDLCGLYLPSFTQLVLRITVALPFWRSGLTKWDGFLELSPGARWLFQNEFKLHILGSQYPMPFPLTSAYLSSAAEIVLPILLILGLGARFAAFGLLIMTGVIQLTFPDAWLSHHLPWAAMLLAIMAWGPGKLAIDHWISRNLGPTR